MASTDEIVAVEDQGAQVDQSRLQCYIGYRLSRASLQVRKLFVRRISALELKPVEFSILVLCDANVGINLRQLGDALDVSPPNLVQVIDRLMKRKLLKRVRSNQDRRIQHINLTDEGRAALELAEKEVAKLEREITDLFSVSQGKVLMQGLRKLALL